MKAMTIRLEDDLYKKIKIMLINKDKSFQEYILELIKKDIKNNEK